MRKKWLLLVLVCILQTAAPGQAKAADAIIVSAAASLTDVMTQMAEKFEQAHPDIEVVVNFASSGSLLRQMIHGAPVDVFASANRHYMDEARKRQLIMPESERVFARNRLVLAVPTGSSLKIAAIDDLAAPAVQRIALGNPEHVPAGRYARQALESHRLWEPLSEKFIYANSVRQVLEYIRRGEVDAGLIYATDAIIGGDAVKVAAVVQGHRPIVYPIAIAAGCRNRAAAARFIGFVAGAEGQRLLRESGFSPGPAGAQ